MTRKRIVAAVLLASVFFGSIYLYRLVWGRPYNIDHFADRYLLTLVWHYPEVVTYLGFIENSRLDFHSNKLSDWSPIAQLEGLQLREEQREILQGYNRDKLQGQQRLTYDVLNWSMGLDHRLARFHSVVLGSGNLPLTVLRDQVRKM